MHKSAGLYIHIPFCQHRCSYCNFYSAVLTETLKQDYIAALEKEIAVRVKDFDYKIDSVYIGGGTPSVVGGDIKIIMQSIFANFDVCENAEITVEMNPSADSRIFLEAAYEAGVNRLSIGAQSASNKMLHLLGRTHTADDTKRAVETARQIGFENISLDIMLALPNSDIETVKQDIDFIVSMNPQHISAYMLKIEEKTAFYKMAESLSLPDDDQAAEQYLFLCEHLKALGYEHYEVSNFCKAGAQSFHNLKYWNCEEYLGIGPGAHSFLQGQRSYYLPNLKLFIASPQIVPDGLGGDKAERFMLKLRLSKGVDLNEIFGIASEGILKKADMLCKAGFIEYSGSHISLTDKGMAVSNSIITEFLYEDI